MALNKRDSLDDQKKIVPETTKVLKNNEDTSDIDIQNLKKDKEQINGEQTKKQIILKTVLINDLYGYVDTKDLDNPNKSCINWLKKMIEEIKNQTEQKIDTKISILQEKYADYNQKVSKYIQKISQTISMIEEKWYELDSDSSVLLLTDLFLLSEFYNQAPGFVSFKFTEKNKKTVAGFYNLFDELYENKPDLKKWDMVEFYDKQRAISKNTFKVDYFLKSDIPHAVLTHEHFIISAPSSLLRKVEKVDVEKLPKYKLVVWKPANIYELTQDDIRACDPNGTKEGDFAHVAIMLSIAHDHISRKKIKQIMVEDEINGRKSLPFEKLQKIEKRVDATINNMIEKWYFVEDDGILTLMIDIFNKNK